MGSQVRLRALALLVGLALVAPTLLMLGFLVAVLP